MQAFCFEKDTEFTLGGLQHVITRVWPDAEDPSNVMKSVVHFEDIHGRIASRSFEELLQSYGTGELRIGGVNASLIRDLLPARIKGADELTDDDRRLIDYRQGYINAVLERCRWRHADDYLRPIIGLHAINTRDPNPPSPSSVRRWHIQFVRGEFAPVALLPRHHKKGNRKRRIDREILELCKKFLSEHYLTMQRNPISEVHEMLKLHISDLNKASGSSIETPSINLLYRLKNEIGAYVRDAARFGRRKANLEYRRGRRGPETAGILDRVEIDHTPLDIVVLCDQTGLPLGRPWLTMVIDAHSRMPLGFHVSFDAPCVQSVLAALGNAIEPKVYVRSKYPRVTSTWPCFGRPMELVCDNGAEFHAQEFKDACRLLGITIHYCPSKDPSKKGRVERFLRTLNEGLCQRLPGTTFGNYIVAGDYDSEKHARIGFAGLMEALHIWLIDIYPNTVHRGLTRTPLAVWNEGATREPPMLPADIHMLKRKVLRVRSRSLSKTGVVNHSITYINDELVSLRERIGTKRRVTIRYDHDDLSHVYVVDPDTKTPFRVDSDNPQYTEGLSLPVHKALRAQLRRDGKDDTDREVMLHARRQLADVIQTSMASTKRAERVRNARVAGLSSTNPATGRATPVARAVTPAFALPAEDDPFATEITDFETA